MSTTIQQGLRPLFLMCFIMGLGVYPVKQSKSRFRWITYISILYFLTIWFLYGCVFFCIFSIFRPKLALGSITAITVMLLMNFTAIMSAISTFYHYKRFQIYMKKLSAVDDTLEKLNIPKTYQKLHIFSKRVIIGWIVHALIMNIYDTIWCLKLIKHIPWGYLWIHIINHPMHINEFTDLLFMFLLWYIGTRFDKINDHMQFLLKKEHGPKYMWKKSAIIHRYFLQRHYKRTLWTSIHLYLELCRIARELNMIFGLQITLRIMFYFGALTSLCYHVCCILQQKHQDIKSLQDIVGFGSVFFSCLIRLYAVNHICESVKNKANNMLKIIQLTNTFRYANIWNESYFFILQVMQHPLKFTGLGLFYFGNKHFQKFFTTIVTFVIIMVQLNIQAIYD